MAKTAKIQENLSKKLANQDGSTFLGVCDSFAAIFEPTSTKVQLREESTFEISFLKKRIILFNADLICKNSDLLQQLDTIISIASEDRLYIAVGAPDNLRKLPMATRNKIIHQVELPVPNPALDIVCKTLSSLIIQLSQSHEQKFLIEKFNNQIKYLLSVSRELNGERNIPKLLNMILTKAREVTNADAGSIYTVNFADDSQTTGKILFHITQNDSVPVSIHAFELPIDKESIVGAAVLHQKPINIPDLRKVNSIIFPQGGVLKHNRSLDLKTGYETRSMLTIPMFDISHQVVGVIQLINRKKHNHEIDVFSNQDIEFAEMVAQQAGIALENAKLTQDIQILFESFVRASVKAIEQRDPTTSGHSNRVALLSIELAKAVNHISTGALKDQNFSEQQIKELEYASLLHDFGKLGVKENVLVKAKKLFPWQMEVIRERFQLIRALKENDKLKDIIKHLRSSDHKNTDCANPFCIDHSLSNSEKQLESWFKLILESNEPSLLPQGNFEVLNELNQLTFTDYSGEPRLYLNAEELKALSVRKGSLTKEEFNEIQSHVKHTFGFLSQIPWGRTLKNVPEIAGKHHEKLDGSGYPFGVKSEQIPIQSRIMTIADIYDALAANDRPYKKAVPVEKAISIIEDEVKQGKLDAELFNVFVGAKIYLLTS